MLRLQIREFEQRKIVSLSAIEALTSQIKEQGERVTELERLMCSNNSKKPLKNWSLLLIIQISYEIVKFYHWLKNMALCFLWPENSWLNSSLVPCLAIRNYLVVRFLGCQSLVFVSKDENTKIYAQNDLIGSGLWQLR